MSPHRPVARLLLALGVTLLAACTSPPAHLTRLWPRGRTGDDPVLGVAVADGVLLLSRPQFRVDDRFEIHFPVGNSTVIDVGYLQRLNNDLAVVRPFTARLAPARLAESLPAPHEPLYLALRDDRDRPVVERVRRWRDGAHGDWIVLPGHDAEEVAREHAGAGLYVKRSGRWRLVGLLAGITAERPDAGDGRLALGYVGLLEIARILPEELDFLDRDLRPLRPDFEHGVPLQPGDLDLPPDPNAPPEASPFTPPEQDDDEGTGDAEPSEDGDDSGDDDTSGGGRGPR